ncbi:hypothetical protein ABZX39_36190 [Streptomyces collinus]|uniref:hypothetical protein n=1 Tax=Streptomyces collinus TaxID=42684 RepID=UPI0033B00226
MNALYAALWGLGGSAAAEALQIYLVMRVPGDARGFRPPWSNRKQRKYFWGAVALRLFIGVLPPAAITASSNVFSPMNAMVTGMTAPLLISRLAQTQTQGGPSPTGQGDTEVEEWQERPLTERIPGPSRGAAQPNGRRGRDAPARRQGVAAERPERALPPAPASVPDPDHHGQTPDLTFTDALPIEPDIATPHGNGQNLRLSAPGREPASVPPDQDDAECGDESSTNPSADLQ